VVCEAGKGAAAGACATAVVMAAESMAAASNLKGDIVKFLLVEVPRLWGSNLRCAFVRCDLGQEQRAFVADSQQSHLEPCAHQRSSRSQPAPKTGRLPSRSIHGKLPDETHTTMTTALLVIDVQQGLCEGEHVPFESQQVIDRINQVSSKVRAAGGNGGLRPARIEAWLSRIPNGCLAACPSPLRRGRGHALAAIASTTTVPT
jgi:hypothetical protein